MKNTNLPKEKYKKNLVVATSWLRVRAKNDSNPTPTAVIKSAYEIVWVEQSLRRCVSITDSDAVSTDSMAQFVGTVLASVLEQVNNNTLLIEPIAAIG